MFLQYKLTSTIYYMMLCSTLSSIYSWLTFSFKIVSKTTLQWATKASWFTASFLFRFWTNFALILEPSETQNLSKMGYQHWPDGLSTLAQSFFLQDIAPRPIFSWFWGLQDVSKAAQDASRRLQNCVKTLPRRFKTPLDTSKTGSDAVHFWQETFLSLQRTMNGSESTKYSSQFTMYSSPSMSRFHPQRILQSTFPKNNPPHPSIHGPAECAERLNNTEYIKIDNSLRKSTLILMNDLSSTKWN